MFGNLTLPASLMEQTQAKSTLALHKEGNKSRNSDLNMAIHKATVLKVEMKGFIREVTSRKFLSIGYYSKCLYHHDL